ncbi:hypothetical protein [Nocardia sp. NPDC057227]|uniref:hypothetical protein n=1 Tax=Nocardia sp. NPDC057227 TaxID=3346056 RepID=UPI00363CBD11
MGDFDGYPPNWPHPRYTDGMVLFENSEHGAAARCFTDTAGAVAEYPEAVIDCLYFAGLAHANAEEFSLAASVLVDGLDMLRDYEPDEHSITFLGLTGQVFIDLGRLVEAAEYLRFAAEQCMLLSEFEEGAELEFRAGRALVEAGTEAAAAVAAFAAAEDGYLVAGRRNDAAETRFERAELAFDADELETARGHLRRALQLFDVDRLLDRGTCWFLLGTISVGLDDNEAAEQQFGAARSCAVAMDDVGTIADCDDMLAELYSDGGRMAEAAAALAAAVAGYDDEHAGRRADCRLRLGAILFDQGDTDEGMALFHAAEADFRAAGMLDRVAALYVLRGRIANNGNRRAEAFELYGSARGLYEQLGDEVEKAWCETLTAGALMMDRPEEAELLLDRSGVVLAPVNREYYLTGRMYLGGVYFKRQDLTRATDLLTTTRVEALVLDLTTLAAGCALQLGGLALLRAEYTEALELLDAAHPTFVAENAAQQLALCRQFQGLCRNALGDHSAAEHALSEARRGLYRHSTPEMIAMGDIHLGLVYLESGRFDESAAAFAHVRDLLLGAKLDDLVPALEVNRGLALLRQRRYPEAAQAIEQAERDLAAGGQALDIAQCRHNLGAVRLLQGDAVAAIAAFESAAAHFATDPGYRRNAIGCELNLGLAHAVEGRNGVGLEYIGRAREGFVEQGMMVEVAKCDLLVAADLFDRYPDRLRDVIALGLPAMLYIGHRRLQFPQASARVAWARLYADLQAMIFSAVAECGDSELMAELVEVTLNSGVHAAEARASVERALATADTPAAGDIGTRSETPPLFAPAGALIAGVDLPMRPAPRLRMPSGSTALAAYIDSAVQRYGGIDPGFEIAAW